AAGKIPSTPEAPVSTPQRSDDIIAGNVSKYAVLPAGYYGQPKKGHLIFDACFESGNLGRVDHITEFEYDLFIRPDTCNPRFRVWFNFTVENVKESQVSSILTVCCFPPYIHNTEDGEWNHRRWKRETY
uniref:Cytosolic carboxypeptidase N-terminal domain-containing protein n=1 Tax=Chrysemys picta bellii TaxID=8478 RepID=A0A8C3FVB5_CHRPI